MRTSIAYRITCPLCERLAMQPCRRLGTETMNLAQVHRARLVEARRKFHGAGSSSKAMSCRCNVTLPKAERFRFNGTEADLKW